MTACSSANSSRCSHRTSWPRYPPARGRRRECAPCLQRREGLDGGQLQCGCGLPAAVAPLEARRTVAGRQRALRVACRGQRPAIGGSRLRADAPSAAPAGFRCGRGRRQPRRRRSMRRTGHRVTAHMCPLEVAGSSLDGAQRGPARGETSRPPQGGRSRGPRGLTGNGGGIRQVKRRVAPRAGRAAFTSADGCPCGLMP